MSSLPIRFGTDGVRARVGDWPITPEGAHRIGLGVGAQAVDAQVLMAHRQDSAPPLSQVLPLRRVSKGVQECLPLGC